MTEDQFEKLARLINETADETVETLRKEIEESAHQTVKTLRQEMVIMKTELQTEMREGFTRIHEELADIRLRLDALEREVKSHSGFAKEIDHILERVVALESRLGITHELKA